MRHEADSQERGNQGKTEEHCPRVVRYASASQRWSDVASIASNARHAGTRIARHVAYADVDALVGGPCRSHEPRRIRHELAAGSVSDVRQNVHVRRGHADAAW